MQGKAPRPNEQLLLSTRADEAAGSLRSPAAQLMARRALIGLVMLASCRTHLRETARSLRDRIAGCYEIRNGDWRSDTLLARFHDVSRLPPRLQLRASLLRGLDELQSDSLPLFEVSAPTQPGYAETPFASWQQERVDADTIRVGQPVPLFQGAYLRLRPTGSSLEGTLTTFTDEILPDGVYQAERHVVLDRVSCSRMALALPGETT